METNDRVQSEYNTGTVKSTNATHVVVRWDGGFGTNTRIPHEVAAGFRVVGRIEPPQEPVPVPEVAEILEMIEGDPWGEGEDN